MNKVSSKDLAIPDQLYAGVRVVLGGHFSPFLSYHIPRFSRAEGATIAKVLNDRVDVLVLGERATTLRKKAESLNKAGATIRIVEDYNELWTSLNISISAAIRQPKCLSHLDSLLSREWLVGDIPPIIGEDYSGIKLDTSAGIYLSGLQFVKCNFTKARLNNVSFRHSGSPLTRCNFRQTKLETCDFSSPADCDFQDAKGTDVSVLWANNCDFRNVHFRGTTISGLVGGEIQDSRFERIDISLSSLFESTRIGNTKFIGLKATEEPVQIYDCELNEVEFRGGEFPHGLDFTDCVLRNVKFVDLAISAFTFAACTMEECSFTRCDIDQWGFDDCDVVNCKTSRCQLNVITASETDLDEFKGIAKHVRYAPDLAHVTTLAEAFASAQAMSITVDVEAVSGSTVQLQAIAKEGWVTTFSWSERKRGGKSDKLSIRGSLTGTDLSEFERAFVWLFTAVAVRRIVPRSLRVTTAKSTTKSKELKQLITAAINASTPTNS